MVARHQPRQNQPVLSVGYSEPRHTNRAGHCRPGRQQLVGAGMAMVSDRDDAAFRISRGSRGFHPLAIDRVSGLDYLVGRDRVILTLYGAALKWHP